MSKALYALIKNWAETKGKVVMKEKKVSVDSGNTL
jgi:hypothetical protein